MKELSKPDFYYIPKMVAEEVSPHEAFVWAVIYWFERMKDGRCYASNQKIVEALPYKSSLISVSNALSVLEEKGFIQRIFEDPDKKIRKEIKINIFFQKIDGRFHPQVNGVSPTGEWGFHPQVNGVSPTDEQNNNNNNKKRILTSETKKVSQEETLLSPLDETTYYTDAPRRPVAAIPLPEDDLIIEPDESVTPTRLLKRKTAPPKSTAPQVFSLFAEVLGVKTGSWLYNKTERLHAEVLFEERGLESIRKALEFYKQNSHDPYCPQVVKPSALASKWSELSIYKRNKKYKEK